MTTRNGTLEIAQELLGSTLGTRTPNGIVTSGIIVETEAYLYNDPASHSYRGRTRRNASMFGLPWRVYVYRSYGVHWCVNVVTNSAGVGEAVLIRAIQPTTGIETMVRRRFGDSDAETAQKRVAKLAAGPGRLCQALGIDGSFDGITIGGSIEDETKLWITPPSSPVGKQEIVCTRRIGISKGSGLLYRSIIRDSRSLSRRGPRRELQVPEFVRDLPSRDS
jgi:DNA-3-methyladenine glycosylase